MTAAEAMKKARWKAHGLGESDWRTEGNRVYPCADFQDIILTALMSALREAGVKFEVTFSTDDTYGYLEVQ